MKPIPKTLAFFGISSVTCSVLYLGVNEIFNKLLRKHLEGKYGIVKNDDGSFRVSKTDSLEETLYVMQRYAEVTGKRVKEIGIMEL